MKTREILEHTGKRILSISRTELYLAMHFLGASLDALGWTMDLSTHTIGTDGTFLRFNPEYLMAAYTEDPKEVNRSYLHMLLHCLFLHMFDAEAHSDAFLWDLSCDVAAEYALDSMGEVGAIWRLPSDFRREWYERFEEDVKILTAQRLYRYFERDMKDPVMQERLAAEFHMDDHGFWERIPKDPAQEPPLPPPLMNDTRQDWQDRADRANKEMEASGSEMSEDLEGFQRLLRIQTEKRVSYRDFLKRYAVVREEARVDPDSFDYGFYHYGMELYGNMPLIEENEYREARKVEELVIAIDTSASCQEKLVARFLNETAGILAAQESFFHHMDLRILQCDEEVRRDTRIHNADEMKQYLDSFAVDGGAGTDFRPVFRYVQELQARGELRNLRGLIYFTDGKGHYPERPAPYETAFVFFREDYRDLYVPSWAIKVYLGDGDELELVDPEHPGQAARMESGREE